MQTRKQFIRNALTIATGAAWLTDIGNLAIALPTDSPYFIFDLHCHPGRLFASEASGFGMGSPKQTLDEMNAAHLSGAFFSLVADSPLIKLGEAGVSIVRKFEAGEAWKEYQRQMLVMKEFISSNSITIGKQRMDLNNYKKSGTVTAYLSVEGGDFLEGNTDKIDIAYSDGVRSIQLVHYMPNGIGDLQTSGPTNNGLSAFGKEVVRRMNKLGMVIDVAHASYQTVKDIARLTDSPIILSHSILEMETNRPMAKRAISKDHAKIVAQSGGLIGAWPSGFNKSFEEYIDNILRLVDAVGVDHVGIGTDMDGNFKPVLPSYSRYPAVAEGLKGKGLSQNEVGKIMGENSKALLKKIFKQ